MSQFLLILGVALLGIGLRSFTHPLLHKLGSLSILATSYLIGTSLTGHWQVGAICAASWILLPWIEILTRVRRLRLPATREIHDRRPPSREAFPALRPLTDDLEEAGFRQVNDAGWEWDDHHQFLRIFYKADESMQASICMIDQERIAFYYLSFSSRDKDGTLWTTWNYPFGYSMQFPPSIRMNRVSQESTIEEMMESHRAFLAESGVNAGRLAPSDPDTIQLEIQRDLEAQIAHNVSTGLLLPEPDGRVRYSWRGLLFLWMQFLRDLVRLS